MQKGLKLKINGERVIFKLVRETETKYFLLCQMGQLVHQVKVLVHTIKQIR